MGARIGKMHTNKVGMSTVISFVLLIMLVVSIGAFVTVWYKRAAEKQVGETVGSYVDTNECEKVKYEVVFNYVDEGCDLQEIEIYNLGAYTISKIQADYYMEDGTHETVTDNLEEPIQPKWGQPIKDLPDFSRVKFTPVIIVGRKEISCTSDREFSGTKEGC